MYAIFVTINVKPGSIEAFADASLGDGQGSTRDEVGCFRFDILKDPNVEGRFYLYEVYLNQDSFDKHRATPHFQKWWATVENMLDGELEKVEMETVFPSDAGWQAQKTGLLNW